MLAIKPLTRAITLSGQVRFVDGHPKAELPAQFLLDGLLDGGV
jgi:hypothetical protein